MYWFGNINTVKDQIAQSTEKTVPFNELQGLSKDCDHLLILCEGFLLGEL